MSEKTQTLITNSGDAILKASALLAASPIVLAVEGCDPELREEAVNLFKQLNSGELDDGERYATLALLAEILFPNSDERGRPGLDLEEAEEFGRETSPEAKRILEQMDREEASFAERLRDLMKTTATTQEQLAAKLGIGQSAISMMLQRTCRPQRRTVNRLAEALGVTPDALWPNFEEQ